MKRAKSKRFKCSIKRCKKTYKTKEELSEHEKRHK